MAIASVVAVNGVKLAATSQAYLESKPVKNDTKALLSEICRRFHGFGSVSGTDGSIAIKVHEDSISKRQHLIPMLPSGVKERMVLENMYVLSHGSSVLSSPPSKPYPHKPPKCPDCGPLFMKAYGMRNARTVIHSHGMKSCLVTVMNHHPKEFWGPIWSIKGISRDNTGINISVKAGPQDLDNKKEPLPRCIVLDIEGTTTPISFVTDVLFPYARDNVGKHLILTYDTAETQDDIKLLRLQVEDDLEKGVAGAVPIPSDDAAKEEVIAALVANGEAMIKADRKIAALKQLQGHIWRTGFLGNELEGVVFNDVPEALERWHALGIKVYIYSSGSRLAQRLIFGKSNYGDLRKYLSGFFDTAVGNKREISSYVEISESVGVDKPSEILFITDVYQEAVAATAAGLEVAISIRPGNGPLPDNHGFQTINSFSEI